jgi:hypothetical protein
LAINSYDHFDVDFPGVAPNGNTSAPRILEDRSVLPEQDAFLPEVGTIMMLPPGLPKQERAAAWLGTFYATPGWEKLGARGWKSVEQMTKVKNGEY